MRDRFGNALLDIMEQREEVMYLSGDVANPVLLKAKDRFPDRILNCGIAEQAMMGIAAGLALEGKTVVVNSIGNFPTERCLEQIRDDVCYHDLDVKVCTTGGGFSYGALGVTHNSTEDFSFMRSMPHMTCYTPGDPDEAEWATRQMLAEKGPAYLRMGYRSEQLVPKPEGFALKPGRAACYAEGSTVAILTCGNILLEGYGATNELHEQGVSCALYSFPVLKPLDVELVRELAGRCELVATVEENVIAGGFGSAVAEVLAELPAPRARLVRMGLDDEFPAEIGDKFHLRRHYGLDAKSIVARVNQELAG